MRGTYIVYVLYSEKFCRTYVGQTNKLEERICKHNRGAVDSTRPFKPWNIIHTEKYETRAEAMRREKWLKSGRGRDFIKKLAASA